MTHLHLVVKCILDDLITTDIVKYKSKRTLRRIQDAVTQTIGVLCGLGCT